MACALGEGKVKPWEARRPCAFRVFMAGESSAKSTILSASCVALTLGRGTKRRSPRERPSSVGQVLRSSRLCYARRRATLTATGTVIRLEGNAGAGDSCTLDGDRKFQGSGPGFDPYFGCE